METGLNHFTQDRLVFRDPQFQKGQSCADGGSCLALLTAGLGKKRRLPHNVAQCSTMAHNGTTSRATTQHQTKWLLSAARCFTFGDKEPRLIMPICQHFPSCTRDAFNGFTHRWSIVARCEWSTAARTRSSTCPRTPAPRNTPRSSCSSGFQVRTAAAKKGEAFSFERPIM